jgi:hypothetical protein
MSVALDKNAKYRLILKTTYERHQKSNQSTDASNSNYVEFSPNSDPDGSLVGCALELSSRGYLIPIIITRFGPSYFAFSITEEGKNLFEDKQRLESTFPLAEDNVAFIIMSFSDNAQSKDAYDLAIKPTVLKKGLNCIRVDEIEHNRRITDKILENIKKSRLIIADLSEQRPNCYYELGYAHALGKEVIHIIRQNEVIHFDVKDYNFIIYESVSELKERLTKRLNAL